MLSGLGTEKSDEKLYLIKRGAVLVAGKKASGKSSAIAEMALKVGEI